MAVKVAVVGTERSRKWEEEAIEAAYGHIENFSAKCRILSDLVGIYVLYSAWEGVYSISFDIELKFFLIDIIMISARIANLYSKKYFPLYLPSYS